MHAAAHVCRHCSTWRTPRVAPRAQGRQEEDSHELLRKLLDGLELEEKRARGDAAQARRLSSAS